MAIRLPFGLMLLILGNAVSATAQAPKVPDPHQRFAVRYVLDGDTIDVAGVGRVRLLGIDAPEIGISFDTPAPFAREARDQLVALLQRRWVTLQTDGDSRDRYSRLLAYVVRDDGRMINVEMVRAGLARVSAHLPLRLLPALRSAEETAQAARKGMWGERPSIPSRSYRIPRTPRASARSAPQQ